ncbi:hypothetical protein B9Q03_00735 [Candidatus Marsarchaeota G2 archaeon OSP_D]|jgi:hypothetical protein|uniref:Uncharacterized protein n=6 Tax=Candidatus Marsarchaeota group 2 TaxID=2203771 RepID=A0A2R6CC94_9ARCH|nr:MAG: hypothetical protein B9Q08_02185 [Candidatus Marsarchaeota G2 archaeon ECH_B_SAG-M15]PSN92576.1 MAG: hypothetical protein B9Q03_00735 [Candidatus Marsarchaeota G2 archaeon OSP_D]PSN96658.1 MAG: hypothetical protein B9Q06_00480 [Candidatus Marsarchaeota G2 archaeon ECH_B_2]PSO00463.1 MAG: hypothetical protein B9Q07_03860 [Candidatus Marsarchaeota G2 archaeon ECH_B_3]PSO03359.1 MAG: hypothetical protein B9Q05_00480 [Candidatus Marsarchaeota G2 archaeon ECH_B_1]PSO08461.1 MAG: hypothetica
MQLSKQLTVEGPSVQEVFDFTVEYIKSLGYQVVDIKPNLVFTKKTLIDDYGKVAELWLSVSVLGEHYITVFMDYQLRSQERSDGSDNHGVLLAKIEEEYEGLWQRLRRLSK